MLRRRTMFLHLSALLAFSLVACCHRESIHEPPDAPAGDGEKNPPALPTASASVNNPSPTRSETVVVSVHSNLPLADFTAIAHYKTTGTVQSGKTDASGTGWVSFKTSGASPGFRVVVDVDISGKAKCSTSFTPR